MPAEVSRIIEWIDKLIDEKIRLESILSKREELLKRNIDRDLIHSSIEDSRKKIAQAKTELASLLEELGQK